ncbi:hypothetical protein Bca52824_001975 [Brassica carinata]|uniref:1-phosphatidylinositol 4-kinase n=1 Tax=Brassica carinata TaxID=52824 RepID=A0A8X7WL69_BRACI|nr:hypothetical protein Bca52824_001975 [Brassica carinata]
MYNEYMYIIKQYIPNQYVLDHSTLNGREGFGRAPHTSIVCKKFSLQQYIPNPEWNHKSEVFAIEDNNDRHNSNILNLNINGARIIPIDHGECFPKWNTFGFVWMKLSQTAITYSCFVVDYVKNLDIKHNLDILKEKWIELVYEFMIIAYCNNKETITNVMNRCMSLQSEAGSDEESRLLDLVHERTKSALNYNKRYEDLKGSTSTYRR